MVSLYVVYETGPSRASIVGRAAWGARLQTMDVCHSQVDWRFSTSDFIGWSPCMGRFGLRSATNQGHALHFQRRSCLLWKYWSKTWIWGAVDVQHCPPQTGHLPADWTYSTARCFWSKNEGNSKAVCQEKNSSCHPLVPSFLLPLVLRLRHAGPVAPWVRGPPTQMSRDTGLSESGAAGTEFQLWTNLNLLWNFPAIKHGWKVRTVDELKVALWKAKNLD